MNLNKAAVLAALINQLEHTMLDAMNAAENARLLATHEQSKPETQYDTVGLEASYLAHGQSQRAADLKNALEDWKSLKSKQFDEESPISAGALVELLDSTSNQAIYLVGNFSGGIKIIQEQIITVISLSSPLGKAMRNKAIGDEFSHPVNPTVMLEIISVC